MHTLCNTMQLGTTAYVTCPIQCHFKPRNPQLNVPHLQEAVACDTFFAYCHDCLGATCAQVFFGCKSKMINVYSMTAKREAHLPRIVISFAKRVHQHYCTVTTPKCRPVKLLLKSIVRLLCVMDSLNLTTHSKIQPHFAPSNGVKHTPKCLWTGTKSPHGYGFRLFVTL